MKNVVPMPRFAELQTRVAALEYLVVELISTVQKIDSKRAENLLACVDDAQWMFGDHRHLNELRARVAQANIPGLDHLTP
jgi:hypothetical protein